MTRYGDVNDITSFKWATVTGMSPLAIRLDGDDNPLALIPDSLVDPRALVVGDRVRVELSLRRVVVHGKSQGARGPAQVRQQGVGTNQTGGSIIDASGNGVEATIAAVNFAVDEPSVLRLSMQCHLFLGGLVNYAGHVFLKLDGVEFGRTFFHSHAQTNFKSPSCADSVNVLPGSHTWQITISPVGANSGGTSFELWDTAYNYTVES